MHCLLMMNQRANAPINNPIYSMIARALVIIHKVKINQITHNQNK